jgi:hypothetical protein
VLFNAAKGPDAASGVSVSGDARLTGALLCARSVIV